MAKLTDYEKYREYTKGYDGGTTIPMRSLFESDEHYEERVEQRERGNDARLIDEDRQRRS